MLYSPTYDTKKLSDPNVHLCGSSLGYQNTTTATSLFGNIGNFFFVCVRAGVNILPSAIGRKKERLKTYAKICMPITCLKYNDSVHLQIGIHRTKLVQIGQKIPDRTSPKKGSSGIVHTVCTVGLNPNSTL